LSLFAWSKGRTMNEVMLLISTISSVLASIAALASELRSRRRDRGGAPPYAFGHTVAYDGEATADAPSRLVDFLGRDGR
jgi:hypothetical protein